MYAVRRFHIESYPEPDLGPRQNSFLSFNPQGFHRIAYVEWGDRYNPRVLICVHGLTRNSRDFDFLAKHLSKDYRVICPDLIGRGESDYVGLSALYNFPQYLADISALLARIKAQEIHWLGTSLGGLLGMMMASQPFSPLKSLIVNDVGMIVPSSALQRIEAYARHRGSFESFDEARGYFQTILSPFGMLEPEHWDHITKYGTKLGPEGDFHLAYDPVIGQMPVGKSTSSLHFDAFWQSIQCDCLVLRGEDSDFLPTDIVNQMLDFQPSAKVVTIPGCGHAPSLMIPGQIQLVEEWLEKY